ncbi:MAG: YfiR family protein [Planctomycetota bacterium]
MALLNRAASVLIHPLCLFSVVGLLTLPVTAQEFLDREYKIKAAIIYHLAEYTEWPADAFSSGSGEFVIGVIGVNPFGRNLDLIAEKKRLKGRRVALRSFKSAKERDITGAHLLILPAAEAGQLADLLKTTADKPILVVAESPGFAEKGVEVNLLLANNKTVIEINLEAAKRAGLSFSAQLLKLKTVKIVEDRGNAPE